MEDQEIFLLLQPTLSFISFFRPGASFVFRPAQEIKFFVLSYISTMHFSKVFILPVILALTVAAAPVPAPNGNLVTLVARCHDPTNPHCQDHHHHHRHVSSKLHAAASGIEEKVVGGIKALQTASSGSPDTAATSADTTGAVTGTSNDPAPAVPASS
ncbi:hypothetical protein FRC15_002818 [Serendipita sp. 397]|nr:hypothetical protein FRC15_002818 [Serendipita sp. 397]